MGTIKRNNESGKMIVLGISKEKTSSCIYLFKKTPEVCNLIAQDELSLNTTINNNWQVISIT